jgi:tetratricopeptide (TPR) repeat protein
MAVSERTQDGAGSESLFVAATMLARRGRYKDASSLLVRALQAKHCSKAEALDLQARMLAQQGFYREAEACWLRANTLDGSRHAYDRALDRLWRTARASSDRFTLIVFLAATAILAWQLVSLAHGLHESRAATARSLVELRTEMQAAGSRAHEHNLDVQVRVAQGLNDVEARIVERLQALSTAAGVGGQRDAIMRGAEAVKDSIKVDLAGLAAATAEVRSKVEGLDAIVRSSASPGAPGIEQSLVSVEKQVAQLLADMKDVKDAVHSRR